MDITDIIGKGPDLPRPIHPDMDRIMEIVLEMKAITQEYEDRPDEFMAEWRKLIEKSIDFDCLAYQAVQVALSIFNVKTGSDFMRLKASGKRDDFLAAMQAFYDGFLLGVQFEKRGGHREDHA